MIPLLLCFFACTTKENKDSGEEFIDYPLEVLSETQLFLVRYQPTPNPIPLNEEFSIQSMIYDNADHNTALQGLSVDINAEMPEHQHGMPQLPTINEEDGKWIADGMLFQMEGYWEIHMYITHENQSEIATFQVDCCR